ncbi:DUF1489 family protein [Aestuariibius insulae]|uniref:DUF1489 family protein n=1 Tax=Aestuariibius insulae TaxID=2058287 RepID=UPI00345E16D1
MTDFIHMQKLSVGSESVESLIDWQQNRSKQRIDGRYYHQTRMWPKRVDEILAGGSIYWVIAGVMQARQRIISFEPMIGADGISRCAIMLDDEIVRTEAVLRRPFQGWRYLKPEDAPRDLPKGRDAEAGIPPSLSAALAEIGVR